MYRGYLKMKMKYDDINQIKIKIARVIGKIFVNKSVVDNV